MPVYLMTGHSYRSWGEDHPEGYVQRGEGRKEPDEGRARYRRGIARFEKARFGPGAQAAMHDVVVEVAGEMEVRVHGVATCPTHLHVVVSFRSPACTCGVSKFCRAECVGRARAEEVFTRMKRKMGKVVAELEGTLGSGRPWFSRGWDVTPVRGREHLAHLLEVYLPDHETTQGGVFRRYG